MHEAIASLAGLKMTTKNIASLHQGVAQIIPRIAKLRGRAPWLVLPSTNALLELAQKQDRSEQGRDILVKQIAQPRQQLVLICQHCGAERDFHGRCPITNGRWISLVCQPCNTISTINKWQCVCNTPWHTCHRHAPIGFHITRPPKRNLSRLTRRRTHNKLSPLGTCDAQPVKRVHHDHHKDRSQPPILRAATGHHTRTPHNTTTTHKQRKLNTPEHLCKNTALATSRVLQRYVERGDVKQPKTLATTSTECVGHRTKVKAAEAFISTTERIVKRLRPSLVSDDSGGAAAGIPGCDSLHPGSSSSGREWTRLRQVDGNPSVVGGRAGNPVPPINLMHIHSHSVT